MSESDRILRIDAAFRAGDLAALRAAVENPSVVPNGVMPLAIGPCLVYAIYHSPLPFIRTLLELGADPSPREHDGFPPLIAALSCSRAQRGAPGRTDVADVLSLLLSFGSDPGQRGINDYTPLHMAVAERNAPALEILLDAGADPAARTRIDECETPREMAERAGLRELAQRLVEAEQFRVRLGGCLCGAIRYRLTGDPVTLYACHCTDCQTATGSSFALSMIVQREAVALVRGQPELYEVHLADGRTKRAYRCAACSTHLWGEPLRVPNLRVLHPGTLDDTSWLEPAGHIWTRSKQPWVELPAESLSYEGQPEDMLPLIRAWKARTNP